MTDSIQQTTQLILDFVSERDWNKFHNPKDMAISLCLESAELMDLYQWNRQPKPERVKEEMADVAIYLFELSSIHGIDLLEAVREKLRVNAEKYPVEKFKGSDRKYNQL